ncbi:LacI family DNA-binding transcriptional regulator [Microbacterium xanthum]|uniref:LacI family DNA-binding transcriptional regulator n=1 Tax=Microbacterium xanthum TaxID=3079794 RepID=UPI002AD2BA45|nr:MULTISPECIES: LacI family DNA-binding transcriptional regulator [unclassified Microbacterium]MDZ8173300.1 LacI family DNA-binding transcriptional regulator [Microbacterium sp. KSW-48]MDZ8202269.1 LacI family DNA-binding transcriptional regulator [Microbacterium sp. SSW1-59]
MVSIDDVAREAGVSTATVSRTLSGKNNVSDATRARVESAVKTLGYSVSASASNLASGRTRTIGVIVPFLDRWFFTVILSGIAAALAREGYDITLHHVAGDAAHRRDILDGFLRRRRVDGIIAVSIELDERETDGLLSLGIPVIAVGGPNPRIPTLSVDDVQLARLATEHLLTLGHERLAHIGADPDFDLDFHIPTRRWQGFLQALADAGISPPPTHYEPADFTVEGGYHAAKQILGRPGARPTAIFAASDEMAIGAILAAKDLGFRVPEDMSVVGIDGHELGGFFQLTTVDQFPLQQGERAAVAILDQLNTPRAFVEHREDSPYELIVRGSTARPSTLRDD